MTDSWNGIKYIPTSIEGWTGTREGWGGGREGFGGFIGDGGSNGISPDGGTSF